MPRQAGLRTNAEGDRLIPPVRLALIGHWTKAKTVVALAFRANETPEARGNEWKSVSGNNQLGVCVAAHAVDRAGRASADGVSVATRMLGGDGNGRSEPPMVAPS
jgi:hypothetical protein